MRRFRAPLNPAGTETDASADGSTHSYNCVTCLATTPTLYKRFSSAPNSVKLTTCTSCRNDVDPYVEREMLLVAIDLVLHRTPAYRHVLFNRETFVGFLASGDVGVRLTRVRRVVMQSLAASFLQAYLMYESLRGSLQSTALDPAQFLFPRLLALSILEHATLVLGAVVAAVVLLRVERRCRSGEEHFLPARKEGDLVSRLHMAMTLPLTFHFVTVFVLIWENTPFVKVLGSLFVLSFQRTAVSAVMERAFGRPTHVIFDAIPFLAGVALRWFCRCCLTWRLVWNQCVCKVSAWAWIGILYPNGHG